MTDINIACFLSCVKTGNISLTADELSMTHQAVSRNIKKFEEEIGHKLFIRGLQPMRLSLAGEAIFQWLIKREQGFEWINDYYWDEQNDQGRGLRIAFVDWAGLPECIRTVLASGSDEGHNTDYELYPGSEGFIMGLFHSFKTEAIIIPDRVDPRDMSSPDLFSAPLISSSTLRLCYSRSFVNADGSTDYKRLFSTKLLTCIDRDWLSDRLMKLCGALCSENDAQLPSIERVQNFNSILSEAVLGNGFTFCSNVLPHISSMKAMLKFDDLSKYSEATIPMICVWRLTTRSERLLRFTEMVCKL